MALEGLSYYHNYDRTLLGYVYAWHYVFCVCRCVTKLTENISTLRISDLVPHLGCSFLTDLISESVHSEQR